MTERQKMLVGIVLTSGALWYGVQAHWTVKAALIVSYLLIFLIGTANDLETAFLKEDLGDTLFNNKEALLLKLDEAKEELEEEITKLKEEVERLSAESRMS